MYVCTSVCGFADYRYEYSTYSISIFDLGLTLSPPRFRSLTTLIRTKYPYTPTLRRVPCLIQMPSMNWVHLIMDPIPTGFGIWNSRCLLGDIICQSRRYCRHLMLLDEYCACRSAAINIALLILYWKRARRHGACRKKRDKLDKVDNNNDDNNNRVMRATLVESGLPVKLLLRDLHPLLIMKTLSCLGLLINIGFPFDFPCFMFWLVSGNNSRSRP